MLTRLPRHSGVIFNILWVRKAFDIFKGEVICIWYKYSSRPRLFITVVYYNFCPGLSTELQTKRCIFFVTRLIKQDLQEAWTSVLFMGSWLLFPGNVFVVTQCEVNTVVASYNMTVMPHCVIFPEVETGVTVRELMPTATTFPALYPSRNVNDIYDHSVHSHLQYNAFSFLINRSNFKKIKR